VHKVEDAVICGGTCCPKVRGAPNVGTQRTVGSGGSGRACVMTDVVYQRLGHVDS
jgi:hypothetical protein